MTNGILYAIFYFSVIPLFGFYLADLDLEFFSEKFFLTKKYSFDTYTIYVSLLIATSGCAAFLLFKNKNKHDPLDLLMAINKLRRYSYFILSGSIFVISLEVLNFFYIDHQLHWLEREKLSLIPQSIYLYLNPIFLFFTFVSIIHLCLNLSCIISNKKIDSIYVWAWSTFDIFFISLLIYNSGNRWYLALFMALIFYFSDAKIKNKILFISPLIILMGGFSSVALLAIRTGNDPSQFLIDSFNLESANHFFIASIFAITEGMSLPTLIELSRHSLYNPDPFYPILKLIQAPLPGQFFEKLPAFNLHVTYTLTGFYSEWSLNSTLLGPFVYGTGFAALPIFILFLFLVNLLQRNFRIYKNPVSSCFFFCLFFAGYRFGFEFLFVGFIYFTIILLGIRNKLIKFNISRRLAQNNYRHENWSSIP